MPTSQRSPVPNHCESWSSTSSCSAGEPRIARRQHSFHLPEDFQTLMIPLIREIFTGYPPYGEGFFRSLQQSKDETVRPVMELALLDEKIMCASFHLPTALAYQSPPIGTRKMSHLIGATLSHSASLYQIWKCFWDLLSIVCTNLKFYLCWKNNRCMKHSFSCYIETNPLLHPVLPWSQDTKQQISWANNWVQVSSLKTQGNEGPSWARDSLISTVT